jgi:hypothetical protein
MTRSVLAAAALATALTAPAWPQAAQGTTSTPCPSDTGAKAKLRKGLGNIFHGTAIGTAIAGQPPNEAGCTASTAQAAAPAPQQSASSSAPPPAAQQPKPGTSRIVRYNGQPVAIATGTDEHNQPRTYIRLPGSLAGVEVRLTTNPDVYVSLAQPPTVYSVDKSGNLTITEPAKPAAPPELHTGTGSRFFQPGVDGDVVTVENMHLQWSFRPGYELPFITLSMHLKSAGGRPMSYTCAYAGHDAQGVDYINCSQGLRYRISKAGSRASLTETELPDQLDRSLK